MPTGRASHGAYRHQNQNLKPGIKPLGNGEKGKPAFRETNKPYRVPDEKGLHLEVYPNRSKYWRMK